jgi:8-oxo-dGTP pyrophosphatase MutT (NUDIX family)
MRRRSRRVKGLRIVKRLGPTGPGFLTLERFVARNVYGSGELSRPYRFEVVHRRGLDAVAIVPFFFLPDRSRTRRPRRRLMIVLKVGFRPGLHLRSKMRPPLHERRKYTFVLEAVAGSLEPGDRGTQGIDARARAELLEETGLRPRKGRLIRLGSGFFPSHGQSTEKVHLRAFEVDPARADAPAGDGSVNEGDSGTLVLEAGSLLDRCRRGTIEDPKLEIGVSRLCRLLGYREAPSGHRA